MRNTSQNSANKSANKMPTLLNIKSVLECFAAETSLANCRLDFSQFPCVYSARDVRVNHFEMCECVAQG